MKRELLKEVEVESVSQLRKALEGMAEETRVEDIFGAPVVLATYREPISGHTYIEVA